MFGTLALQTGLPLFWSPGRWVALGGLWMLAGALCFGSVFAQICVYPRLMFTMRIALIAAWTPATLLTIWYDFFR